MIKLRFQDPPIGAYTDEEAMELLGECMPVVAHVAEMYADAYRAELSTVGDPMPGEPPRKVEGHLVDSIVAKPARRVGKLRVVAEAGSAPAAEGGNDASDWAARLEFGGKDAKGRYLPPHPWRRRAEERIASRVEDYLSSEIEG